MVQILPFLYFIWISQNVLVYNHWVIIVSDMCCSFCCQASHYLFKGLPLMQWLPTPQDMDLLREWLLDSPPTSPQNNLARIVVEQMNWSSYPHGADLFLCRSMHRTVATLLVQMYRFHLAGKNVTSLMVDNLQVVRVHGFD